MSAAPRVASLAYAEEFVPPHPVIERARRRGEELGATPIGQGAGALIRLLAAGLAARHVVEIGTGAGSSALWAVQGMPRDGVITSIDIDPEAQRAAREAFTEAGIPSQRTRFISGDAAPVLQRLADGAYDMVIIDADPESYPVYAEEAIRVLRTDGLLVVNGMLGRDRVADPAARDEATTLLRDLGKKLREDDRLMPAMVAAGDGLFLAVRR